MIPSWLRRAFAASPFLLTALFLLAAVPARAERIQGTLTYHDDLQNLDRPIARAKVEVWRYAPRFLGIWSWDKDATLTTGENGWIDADMPWAASGVVYALRVFATNDRVVVWPQDAPHVSAFYAETPQRTAFGPGDVLDFNHNFGDAAVARYFNIADTVRMAGDYMATKYAPLPRVSAQPTAYPISFFDPFGDTLQITARVNFNDFIIAHEYGHYVEDTIGNMPVRPSFHELCEPSDPGLAWMEGFADYFAYAVDRVFPGQFAGGMLSGGEDLEPGDWCPDASPRDSVEYFIAAALFDLADGANETHDLVAGKEATVLAIVDNELGVDGLTPTIWDFRNAWHGRSWNLKWQDLDRILVQHGFLAPFQDAEFVRQSVPTSLVAGRSAWAEVVMRNTGSTTWKIGQHRLGSQSPQDNLTWGFHRMDLPEYEVPPGGLGYFGRSVTAPASPGPYTFQWRMVQEMVEWFGPSTPPVQVGVTAVPQSAQFVSQSVPSAMNANGTYAVSVTLLNNGETTWQPGTHFLGSQNPQDNRSWGLNRVPLPAPVPPGGQVTLSFNVTAPVLGGDYAFQWRMLQDGLGGFGDWTANVMVRVNEPAPVCNSTKCVDDCISSGCAGGKCSYGKCVCLKCY